MRRALVVGGGLAGLASAAALAQTGYEVDLLEARAFPGGRAASYPIAPDSTEHVDNCQHVLLRCCANLLDFYRRLGVEDAIQFHKEFYFLEPGGRGSVLRRGWLRRPPLHLGGSFVRMRCLGMADKIAIARALRAVRKEWPERSDLDRISMRQWLEGQSQTGRAIDRFWRPVLVSAINEELEHMAASHGLQVFAVGLLSTAESYEMGIPAVPLSQLYSAQAWERIRGVRLHYRVTADRFVIEDGAVRAVTACGCDWKADAYVCALPFDRVPAAAPELGLSFEGWQHSPITGIHLWFDRKVTDLPHATLLDRNIQWMFNKGGGSYIQVVVSASRSMVGMARRDVISLALRELAEFLPAVREARLTKAHVVKEVRATFSARPGLEGLRPPSRTRISNLYLAGDWTRSGWPATMEGAVRSGYLAAEAITGERFLLTGSGGV
jgi:zeta-carotene desaturase